MKGLVISGAVIAVLVVLAIYAMRTLAPVPEASNALMAAHNKMMGGMMGSSITYTGDADFDFVALMIPHHQGAVDMAEVELKYGRDEPTRDLAKKIVASQTAQIEQMRKWQQSNQPESTADAEAEKQALMAANDSMMKHMNEDMSHTGNPDLDFVVMMIPHHQGAVDMAEVQLRYGQDPEIRVLCQNIIDSQKAEIAEMNEWLEGHAPQAHHHH